MLHFCCSRSYTASTLYLYMSSIVHTTSPLRPRLRYLLRFSAQGIYLPVPFIICACCSAKRCPIRSLPAMNFCTQRLTQPVSRAIRDLVVKSSMQASKQRSTRPENICARYVRMVPSYHNAQFRILVSAEPSEAHPVRSGGLQLI